MLDIIRNLVSSIFGKVLLAIMVLSFALWGVGDILTSGNSRLAAKVGDEKISLEDFYINFQQTLRDISNSSGMNISIQQAKDQQLDNNQTKLIYEGSHFSLYEINDSLPLYKFLSIRNIFIIFRRWREILDIFFYYFIIKIKKEKIHKLWHSLRDL